MHSFGKENRWQAPFGAVGIGTWAVLSSIPEGACACGAEGHMASIGPPALGAKGCVERLHHFAQGGRRLAVRITIEYQIGALPRTHFPATREFPSRGNERYEEKNKGVICFMYYSSIPPLLVSGATTFPPLRGGTTTCAYCRTAYEESVSRCFILPPA